MSPSPFYLAESGEDAAGARFILQHHGLCGEIGDMPEGKYAVCKQRPESCDSGGHGFDGLQTVSTVDFAQVRELGL